ncbi:hypothetical protein FOMPIDRAFT_1130019, partial [Fomitopsis schrenkii]
VWGTLFKVHRHFFQQYSQNFAEKYMRHSGGGKLSQGDVDDSPIALEDISVLEFLSVFYPKSFDNWELTETEQLVSVLRLARKWEFQSIVGLVARRLTEVASLVDQVALAIEHNLPSLVGPAGTKLCARAEPLTLAESRRLGIDAAYAIWTLRERFRGGLQTVPLSDMAREEKRVQSFFEEAGLIQSSIEGLTRRRSDSSDSGITLRRGHRRRSSSPPYNRRPRSPGPWTPSPPYFPPHSTTNHLAGSSVVH